MNLSLVFFIVWAVLLFGGFLFGKPNHDRSHRIPTPARMFSSLTLVVIAWYHLLSSHNPSLNTFTLLIAIGITLGFLGDLFMAQLLPLKAYVLGGIASFGIGHIAYILAAISIGQTLNLHNLPLQLGTAILCWLIAVILWYLIILRPNPSPNLMHRAALPYALLLSTTAAISIGLALQNRHVLPLAIGSTLFLLSDLILAAQLFNHLFFPLIGDVVWFTYGPAQALIVYTVLNLHLALG